MIIKQIDVLGLGPFRNQLTFCPGPRLNVIAGRNGVGKSMLRDALSLALTGTCAGAEAGIGLDTLRTIGGSGRPWGVSIHAIGASAEIDWTRNDSEGPKSNKQQLVETLGQFKGPAARAALYGSELLRLAPKERQQLLLSLLPKQAIEIPEELYMFLAPLIRGLTRAVGAHDLDTVQKIVYDLRTEAGRRFRVYGDVPVPDCPSWLDNYGSVASLDELRQIYADLEAQISELDQQRASLIIQAGAPVDLEALKRRADETKEAVDRLHQELEAMPSELELEEQIQAGEAASERWSRAKRSWEKQREDLGVAAAVAESNWLGALKRYEEAQEAPEACPSCGSKLSAAKRKTQLEAADKAYTQANEAHENARGALATIGEPPVAPACGFALLGEKKRARHRLQNAIPAALAAAQDAAAAYEAAKGAGDQSDPQALLDASTLASRMAVGRERLRELALYTGARSASAKAASARMDADAEGHSLTEALGQLKQLKAQLGESDGFSEFEEAVNVALEPLGFQVDLAPVMDASGPPLVNIPGGDLVPAPRLSHSQRVRFGAAFGIAVAKYSQLGIVAIDELESCDPPTLGDALGMLEESGLQCFAFVVQDSDTYPETAASMNAAGGDSRWHHLVVVDGAPSVITP